MKKNFFGYNVAEVDVAMNALRDENESLNSTITSLKAHLKNSETNTNAKANLLEDDLRKTENSITQIREENEKLLLQINALSQEEEELKSRNAILATQVENSNVQNEKLINQNSELKKQIDELIIESQNRDTSLPEELQARLAEEKEYRAALELSLEDKTEELHSTKQELSSITYHLRGTEAVLKAHMDDLEKEKLKANTLKCEIDSVNALNATQTEELVQIKARLEDYNDIKEMLSDSQITLNDKIIELDRALKETKKLKEELAVAQIAVDEQAKVKAIELKQITNLNHASDISFQAYHDMSVMRNEVIEYIHGYMKEHYQLVNENNVKLRSSIEQRQAEFNLMVRDFFAKSSEFRTSLSNIDNEYNDISEFNINIDTISARMNEIMDLFLEETGTSLKKKAEFLKSKELVKFDETASTLPAEEIALKSSKIQDFPFVKSDKQSSL